MEADPQEAPIVAREAARLQAVAEAAAREAEGEQALPASAEAAQLAAAGEHENGDALLHHDSLSEWRE